MKTAIKLSIITVILSGFIHAEEIKRYEVKSAKIEYELKGSGNMMGGMVKIESSGKKRLIFDSYGLKELSEENKVSKNTTMGTTKVDKTHSLKYMNGAIIYGVQFKAKRITRIKNPMAGMGALLGGENVTKTGEAMLKKMGGKKIGTDNVAGYSCDVWNLSGVKQCLYKGIPLKIESNIMGLKMVEIAIKAEFDVSLDKDNFKLPDFPIYNMDMKNPQQQPTPLDKSKLEAMDKKENSQAGEESKEAKNGMKAMGVGIDAAVKAGYDMKSGKDMTLLQKEAMQKAMMNAMGGEKSILAKQKQEILEDAKNIPKAKKCFENANSVKEANVCEKMMDSEEPELHSKWNDKIKANLLKDLNGFEKSIDCVKGAESMKALGMCFPRD